MESHEEVAQTSDKRATRKMTYEEDVCMLEGLLEMQNSRQWKGEGGFKAGYLKHLEKLVHAKMPGTDLKADPHMENRLRYLKKQFYAILDLKRDGSGFGWNEEKKMVTGDKNFFDGWVKGHPNARGLLNKPFPLYDILEELFVKDRALGIGAAHAGERVEEEVDGPLNNMEGAPLDGCDARLEDNICIEDPSGSKNQSSGSKGTKKRKAKTKSIEAVQERLIDVFEKMVKSSNEQLATLVDALKESDEVDRNKLHADLCKLPGLTKGNMLKAMRKMSANDIANFNVLEDEEEKLEFVMMILEDS